MKKLTATEVGLRLKEYREAAKMSQSQLAKASDLSISAISKIERGERFPSNVTINAYLMGISIETGTSLDRGTIFPELFQTS